MKNFPKRKTKNENCEFDELRRGALTDIDYQGDITYETGFGNFPNALCGDALKFMYKIGRYMADEIERYKRDKKGRGCHIW